MMARPPLPADMSVWRFGTDSSAVILLTGPPNNMITPWTAGRRGKSLHPDPQTPLRLVLPKAAGGRMEAKRGEWVVDARSPNRS
jgi:hypothetical protein